MIVRLLALMIAMAAAACAAPPSPPEATASEAPESPLSGMIGVAVRADGARVIVSEVGEPARSAGAQVGDVVIEYDGVRVSGIVQFQRLVLQSRPGGRVGVEVLRDGARRVLSVPVHQVFTASRA